ncbi:MAG: tRNA pseudouridine(55) synthase TruB [Parcubacteria group bacterium CG1_02_37_51]|uniref:tRNA pseudouridine synthase B n=2 Tax=Candidatus Komeiliibacteriota TaxID=1817908 RepID=A0A2M8DQW3_9BACT|nr:MAG: tRNA pseudouridine(55) synthase TruB [Parcubacteria group bacterium CG1_02_37_51]PIY94903.1 MAG: tRNA pseudouridine(55) synthase TruB [Candidatus Komeilibacteria bacterium CG_4_10_14_0_8_um_filter_37_78]PJC01767.1 MAG: tRNA pseudouridine(55) synthase TruB [Candidatus Komeilibacteria bacterium CG_4_9_14_0_8_um_filter_36_9]
MDNISQAGFLLIDKAQGWTSFDVIAKLRNITNIKKIGHAGTLDPIATGLLIVAIGREATKQIDQYMKMDKEYLVKGKFGETSASYDTEEKVVKNKVEPINEKEFQKTITKYLGETDQTPPMFSAKKIDGKRLYELARQGKEVERQSVKIKITKLELLSFDYPWFELKVSCSSGTYVRSLTHDLGQDLQQGAVMYELRRTKIGDYNIEQAHRIEEITKANWQKKIAPSRLLLRNGAT